MFTTPKPFLSVLTALALPVFFASDLYAQELSAQLLGGTYAPQSAGKRVAYITTSEHSCTGTLIAQRLVLTAAHCVPTSVPASDYTVYVGDIALGAESVVPHPAYDDSMSDEAAAPYDLGVIVLDGPVSEYAPIPILSGHRVARNQRYLLAGYGTNEDTWDPSRAWEENFKLGATRLAGRDGYLIWGTHTSLGTSICAGDSGGPATLLYGTHLLLVGVASIGVNDLDRGECILIDDGAFAHVDLQSTPSRSFLSNFPDAQFVSHGVATVAGASDTATSNLRKSVKSRSLARLKQAARAQRTLLTSAARYATGERATLLKRALQALKGAGAARTLAVARARATTALATTTQLSALGLS
jgi:hypothetical protein